MMKIRKLFAMVMASILVVASMQSAEPAVVTAPGWADWASNGVKAVADKVVSVAQAAPGFVNALRNPYVIGVVVIAGGLWIAYCLYQLKKAGAESAPLPLEYERLPKKARKTVSYESDATDLWGLNY